MYGLYAETGRFPIRLNTRTSLAVIGQSTQHGRSRACAESSRLVQNVNQQILLL